MAQDWFSQATAPVPPPQAAPQRQGRIIPDRYRASEEARRQEDQVLERQRLELARGDAARSDAKFQFDVANVDRGSVPPGWRRTAAGGLEPEPGGPADPNSPANDRNRLTAEARNKLQSDIAALRNLKEGIDELRSLFDSGRGATKGVSSVRDVLPTSANRELLDSGDRLSAFVATALGLSGQQFNTPAEQKLFLGSYLPSWFDTDAQIERKIAKLESLYNNSATSAASALGIAPPPLFDMAAQEALAPQMRSLSVTNVADFAAGLSGGEYRFTPDGGLTYDGKPVDVGMDVGNSPEFREAYRQQMGEYPPIYADVVGGVVPPAERTRLEQDRDTTFGDIDAFVRGGADMLTLGIADPLAAVVRGAFNDDSFGDNLGRERAISEADERINPVARVSGQIAGGIAPFYGAARLGAGAMPSRPLTGAALGETAAGSFYGGVSTPDDPVAGALVGGGAALVGNQVGQRLIGPAAKSLLSRGTEPASQPVRMLARSAGDLDADPVLRALSDADRLRVPMSLADADPKLRTLAGSSVRLAPAAREFAEATLLPRGRAQANRAVGAIERDFGPAANMVDARAGFKRQAQADSRPFYEQAFSRAAPVDPDIEAMLATPAGRTALTQAANIARNEGRDPMALGFDLDDAGEVIGVQAPSFETLHMVKRGLDSVVEGNRGATGVLNRDDPAIAAIDNLRARFRNRLGELDENYSAGNAAYAAQMRNRDALNFGYDAVAPRINPDVVADALSRMPVEPMQTGYRSGMVDQVERMRYSGNPYDAVYGTPDQVAKVGQLFPEGAQNFARQAELEGMLARTQNETLGGSPTAARQAADAQFAPGLGAQLAGETALGIASGMPPIASITNVARATLRDRMRLGIGGSKRAESIAQLLLEPNPAQALTTVERILLEQELRNQARGAGGLVGASASPALIPAE